MLRALAGVTKGYSTDDPRASDHMDKASNKTPIKHMHGWLTVLERIWQLRLCLKQELLFLFPPKNPNNLHFTTVLLPSSKNYIEFNSLSSLRWV